MDYRAMSMLRIVAFVAALFACTPLCAQWQVPNHAVPLGRGAGITGFGSAVPGATGSIFTSNGPSADPTFQVPAPVNTGRPICDVRSKGAVGDGSTDDTAAFNACVTALSSLGGGVLYASGGRYCIKTPGGVVINGLVSISVIGAGMATIISACGVDTTVLMINTRRSAIQHVAVLGKGDVGDTFGATHSTIVTGPNCTECLLFDIFSSFGSAVLDISSSDTVIMDVFAANAYGGEIELNSGGGSWHIRTKFDQEFPTGAPPTGFASPVPNWAATTAYTKNQVVQVNGFIIQCTQSGTSGGSAPALRNYFLPMTDGTATWQLTAPVTYYGMLLTGTSAQHAITMHDSVASVTNAIQISGNITSLQITNSNFGQHFSAAIATTGAGSSLQVTNNLISGGLFTDIGSAFNIGSAWSGDVMATNNLVYGNVSGQSKWGFVVQGGRGVLIANNGITGFAQGIEMECPITDFVVSGNNLGVSASFGSNAASVRLNAGACDYYNIVNNITHGLAVVDGGTGTHKTLSGNN